MSEGWWLVTGASRGIGRAVALALAEPSRPLLLTATRIEHVEPLCAELVARGMRAEPLAMDLTRLESGRLQAALEGKPLAGLVNNAGVLERGNLSDVTDAQLERIVAVNFSGVVKVTREALRGMRPGARIINIGSISGTLGTPGASLYNATKWAMTGLTKSWAEELKPRGIFVAEVRPGSVDTDMLKQTPFEPQMQPEDVAKVVRYLALEAPGAMTGAAVDVFG
ncbi:MAG: SDR family oxidoreductase [Deltaproteobacteria bacterium]|nr:SDR family oxidoreductase [Deltaproteobacteria bacterium]